MTLTIFSYYFSQRNYKKSGKDILMHTKYWLFFFEYKNQGGTLNVTGNLTTSYTISCSLYALSEKLHWNSVWLLPHAEGISKDNRACSSQAQLALLLCSKTEAAVCSYG